MPCGSCGFANDEAARFCGSCGSPLTAICRQCATPIVEGLRFCTSCGEPVAGDTADAPSTMDLDTPPERRRISVLFVDLENFTSLAEKLDPEEVRSVQARYFEVARAVISAHGGTIEKFIGDAVMAVWGAPSAHEDDAERAVRAALSIIDAVGRLGGAAAGRALTARGAVTTGEAAVSVGTREQGMVSGDLVNVAARLQSLAPAGSVLVDERTRQLAIAAAEYESIGPLALKGRTATISAFRATPHGGPPAGTERGVHTGRFVGRERELRELLELFDHVAHDAVSRLVTISGIAGIGKSRLIWEFRERLDALPQDVAWHAGRAPAYGEGITFAAVGEMVRRRIRVSEAADPELARRHLATALEELVRDEAERRWMEPRVGVLLSRDEEHGFARDELFAAWRRFFERVSDRSPVVVVFEDLQWADPALLDFVEHLAAWTREHPILVVALARPELIDRRPTWGAAAARLTSVHLERLADTAMRELLVGHAPALSDRLVERILERAGGVPLYAVEVLRILATRREADAEGDSLDVPESLQGVIAARIDALPALERRLLLSAAVLGRRFRPEALAAVAATDPTVVRARTDALVRRELLTVDEELVSPSRGQLGFVQDLVREVAYGTLARTERRALHIEAARYLDTLMADAPAESLASHLLEARALAPSHPDASRLARRAIAALRGAAREAIRLHAPERALGHLETALSLADSSEHRATLLEEAAGAARAGARLQVAESHLRELVEVEHAAGRMASAARARAQLASVLLMAQRNGPALAELEAALGALDDIGADPASVEVASQLARARVLVGDDRDGLQWADRAMAGARRLGLEVVATDALVTRGTARVRLGDWDGGLADLQRAIADAAAGGFLATELRARNNLAWLVVADDPRMTLDVAREGFDLATSMGIGDLAVQLGEVACTAALDTGDWEWALATIGALTEDTIPEANRINLLAIGGVIGILSDRPAAVRAFDAIQPLPAETDVQIVSGVTHANAWIAFVNGAFEEARRLAAEAAMHSFGAERSHQLTLQVRASLWLGDATAAASALAELRALELEGRATAASLLTLDAGMLALGGGNAAAGYARAASAWQGLDLPVHLALCGLDAHRLLGTGDSLPASTLAALERVGAAGLLRLAGGGDGSVSSGPSPARPARSRRPTGDTARRKGGGRRPPPVKRPPAPPG